MFCTLIAEELAAWDAEVLEVVASERALQQNLKREVFVRFGRLPEGGRSRSHRDVILADGVSVYTPTG